MKLFEIDLQRLCSAIDEMNNEQRGKNIISLIAFLKYFISGKLDLNGYHPDINTTDFFLGTGHQKDLVDR